MYDISREKYGFKITFTGAISPDEMQKWVNQSNTVLLLQTGKFGVLFDMRDVSPLAPESRRLLEQGQARYREKGMERSAVVVKAGYTAAAMRLAAHASGNGKWERYIDASRVPNWEPRAVVWLVSGEEPS
jgi:hypothetical protein